MYLFAVNEKNTKKFPAYMKLYSCKIYDNGELVQDYIPCKLDNAGLYDIVNGQFYESASGTTFLEGPEVEKVLPYQQQRFKEIADAIRQKDGTSDLIVANDFANRILAIPTGSGGLPDNMRTITVNVSNEEGGHGIGGGVVQEGMSVQVSVGVNEKYKFTGWLEDDSPISKNKDYIFKVNEDRTLVAEVIYQPYVSGRDWWETTEILPKVTWMETAYGNNRYVSIAYNSNQCAYSGDGVNWMTSTMPNTRNWQTLAYGNGKFVALAYNTSIAAWSEDGIEWTEISLPASAQWISVTYGGGKFVAIAYNTSTMIYSEDGITWTKGAMPASRYWRWVRYGGGKFVAIAQSTNYFAYSADGISWITATMPVSSTWWRVAYGGGKFVAITNNNRIAAYSENGTSWTQIALPRSTTWIGIEYGDDKFVVISQNQNYALFSEDGIEWTESQIPSVSNWFSVGYGDDKFIAISSTEGKVAYSGPYGAEGRPKRECQVIATAKPTELGTVDGGGTYKEGSLVTLTATPAPGYWFLGWEENDEQIATKTPYKFIVESNRTIFGNFDIARPPVGYKRVEYIANPVQGTAQAYIDNFGLSYLPFNGTRIELTARIPEVPSQTSVLLGCNSSYYNKNSSNTFTENTWQQIRYNNNAIELIVNKGAVYSVPFTADKMSIIVDLPKMLFKINDNQLTTTMTSGTAPSYSQARPTCSGLFGSHEGYYRKNSATATAQSGQYQGYQPILMNFYEMKVYSSTADTIGELLHYYIACVNLSGVAGIYDMISGVFYPSNSSTATFVAGPEI